MFYNIFLIIFIFIISSCQTHGYFITDSNLIVPESRKAITAVIGKPRFISMNGRELFSDYHDKNFKTIDITTRTPLRYYTSVTILGARRPYEINIQVIREEFEKETGTYVNTGLDDGLSEKRAREIKKAHNYSLEKQQKFDGDNPF
jgi:hypothetical protein